MYVYENTWTNLRLKLIHKINKNLILKYKKSRSILNLKNSFNVANSSLKVNQGHDSLIWLQHNVGFNKNIIFIEKAAFEAPKSFTEIKKWQLKNLKNRLQAQTVEIWK